MKVLIHTKGTVAERPSKGKKPSAMMKKVVINIPPHQGEQMKQPPMREKDTPDSHMMGWKMNRRQSDPGAFIISMPVIDSCSMDTSQ